MKLKKGATLSLPKGYKNTEIGVIPKEWEVNAIPEIIKSSNGIKIGPFGSQLKKELLVKKGYKVYGQENVFKKDMSIGERFLSKKHFDKLKSCELLPGDFIISMMGTIGKSMVVPNNIEKGIMDSHLIRLRLNKKITTSYLLHFFSYNLLLSQVSKLSVGGIMDGLSSTIVKRIQIPLPPLPEQTAIATILSDTDSLIQALEKKIAKKQLIKKGTMQKLLTPKQGWVVKSLGEIAEFYKGKGLPKSEISEKGKIKCIHYGELFTKYSENIKDIISHTNIVENCFYSKINDVLMPTSDVTPNGLATASCLNENNVILGGDVLIIRIYPGILNGLFLSYFISINKEQVMQLVTGSTVYHLYGSDMAKFKIQYPNITEQTCIAQILSDMDAEIDVLEKKLAKYKQIKQGLMQVLLTGKIRLV